MVCPQAMGRAESSNARSLNSSWVNSGRGVVSMADSTLGSVTPWLRSARIRRAICVSGVSSSGGLGCLVISELRRRAAQAPFQVVHGPRVREVDVQRRHRDLAIVEGPEVGAFRRARLERAEPHPIILAAAQISTLLVVADMDVAEALAGDLHL